MQPLEVTGRFLGLRDDVERAGCGVHHGSSRDSDYGVDVAGFTGIGRRNRRDACPEEALLPVLDARVCIGVTSIDTVVHVGDQHDIVRAGRYREVRNVERLAVDLAVHGACEQLAEGRTGHRAGRQGNLLAVLSGPLRVVALRENTGEACGRASAATAAATTTTTAGEKHEQRARAREREAEGECGAGSRPHSGIKANVHTEPPAGTLSVPRRLATLPPRPESTVTYCRTLCV